MSRLEQSVRGALHSGWPAIQDVGVDHGSAHVLVPEELLHGSDIGAVFQQMGRERVAEGVAARALRELGGDDRTADGALNDGDQVMRDGPFATCSLAHLVARSISRRTRDRGGAPVQNRERSR